MQHLLPAMLKSLYTHDQETLFRPEFFETRRSNLLNVDFVQVKPIAQFPGNEVHLGYQIGTRGNGTDHAVWREDLTVESVTGEN